MTDPIRAFLDGGGFRAVADPAGEEVRRKADGLTYVLIHSYLGPDADVTTRLVPELLDGIVGVDAFGAGPLASLELLGQLWHQLVGVPTTFMPPSEDDDLLRSAAGVASSMTLPTTAIPLAAIQDSDVACCAIVMLARHLAIRLDAARSLSGRLEAEAQKFYTS